MIAGSLGELPAAVSRAVVINVKTDVVATLALVSLAHRLPPGSSILLVNCEPDADGRDHFLALSQMFDFDIIEAPTRHHGLTLDWLFRGLHRDGRILLLDSDAEVRDARFVEWMNRKMENDLAFGAGYTWGPFFIPESWGVVEDTVLYVQRPWLPCVMLKVAPVIDALDHGLTFLESYTHNEFSYSNRVAHFLAARWGPPWGGRNPAFDRLPARWQRRMGSWRMDWLSWAAHDYHGHRPKIACFDTAGAIYQYLINDRGLLFAGIPVELGADDVVHHFSGVTRHNVYGHDVLATPESAITAEVVGKLRAEYRAEAAADLVDRLSSSKRLPSR
ncbi:MAG TPA: hypothetical protein VG435_09260 [Acidimicrobiales bacterium]|nr:hypothetical protein [Acidimicrobiales bacterium]